MTAPAGELAVIRCPVCASGIEGVPKACPRCQTPHHPECWDYVGACAIFGCAQGGSDRAVLVAEAVRSPWLLDVWFRLFRLQWRIFLATTVFLSLELSFLPLVMVALSTQRILPAVFLMACTVVLMPIWFLHLIGLFTVVLGPIAYLVLWLPELGLRNWLGANPGVGAGGGPGQARQVADRLAGFEPDSARHRLVERLAEVVRVASMANLAILGLLLLFVGPELRREPGLWAVVSVGWGLAFTLVPRILAAGMVHSQQARSMHIATLQNRLVASGKDRKELPAA